MSTIKISQLPTVSVINANTANSLFIIDDIPTGTTGKATAHTVAQGLYSYEILNVGSNPVVFPNTISQFSGNDPAYLQVNQQNFNANGTADQIITADIGTNTTYYIDLGYAGHSYNPNSPANSLFTSLHPLDGYLYVQGSQGLPGGNLVIGTTTTNTTVSIIVGGNNASNVVASFTPTRFITYVPVYFADGSTQNTAASPINYTQSAYAAANTAYTKANNAIANTNGVITAGDLNVSGNLNVTGLTTLSSNVSVVANLIPSYSYASLGSLTHPWSSLWTYNGWFSGNTIITGANSYLAITSSGANNTGSLTIGNSTFSPNNALVKIDASNGGFAQPVTADGYIIQTQGKDGVPNRTILDSTGIGSYSAIVGRLARGTAQTPTSPQPGDVLFRMAGNGFGNTGYSIGGSARIDMVAQDSFSDTTKGTMIQLWTTPPGSNVNTLSANIAANNVSFTGSVTPQKGFIWVPTVYPGAQTAITIDFANNSVVRAQTATALSVSFTNYTVGKEIQLWLTNTAVGSQTFTHGTTATNSTLNSTTYSIPGTSTILVRYICIDGTLANTYCAITHA